ncbi:MAG TPA: DNA primase, partial [Verrucomicrobiae bacterium]|nr:DNA primase [Verrucomicrobiae bacterium]
DFMEAVKRLAERARIPLEFDQDPAHQEKQFLKDKLFEINEQICQRWHHALRNEAAGERARAYLDERGVSPEAIALFRLGYSPAAWEDTVNWAKSRNLAFSLVETAGLALRKEGTEHCYGRFRDRLMFPICDDQGRVIGFSARVLPGSDDPRKYVNSPETPLFVKSRVMFGLDKSKRAILEKQFAIVCEGQLDLIACFMAGTQNIVAPQGTAFTSEHARIIKRYASEVVLCFDSDEAGQKAAVRVLDDLLDTGLAIRVATLPAPHDPDSFIKNFGAAAFDQLISKAEGFFDYYLSRLCKVNDISTDKGQQTVLAAMGEAVQKTNDPALFDKYAQRTAGRLGISALSATQTFKSAAKKSSARTDPDPSSEEAMEVPAEKLPRPNAQEFWLLKILLQNDDLLAWARTHLHLAWLQHAGVRQIVERRLSLDAEGQPAQPAAILGEVQNAGVQALITEALAEARSIPNVEQQLSDLTIRLRNQSIDREASVLSQSLGQPDLPAEETAQVLQELAALRLAKRSPLAPVSPS